MGPRPVVRLLLRRLAGMLITLLVVSFLVFASLYVAPGSPVSFLLGRRSVTPSEVASVRHEYHLDEPFWTRYWHWLADALHGNLGTSVLFHQSVTSLLRPRVMTTVLLIGYASLLAVGFGLLLGTFAATRGKIAERWVLTSTSVGAAVPSFVAAIFLLYLFSVELGWFPSFGAGSGGLDRIWHLTLPAVALALGAVAVIARYTRTALREQQPKDYVSTAIARGLDGRDVFRRHVCRGAMVPIVGSAGIVVASMIVGVAVVEHAFALNGLGAYLVDEINARDFPVVQAIALVFAASYVVLNTVVDVVYALLDPRVMQAAAR